MPAYKFEALDATGKSTTGLLDAEQSALVAARLASPQLDSGYGLRTA